MKEKTDKGKLYCLISAVIIIGCYAVQKLTALAFPASRSLAIIEAMVFSLFVAVVYFLVTKSKESFYGILISILGFKMMPPAVASLKALSSGADIVYYIVTKAAIVIFAFAIIKLFKEQKYEQKIKALPILFLIVAVPFTNEIASTLSAFVNGYANGNKIYEYFIRFAFYSMAMLVTLFYASKSNKINSKLLCDYTIIALLVNLARRISVIVIYSIQGFHISKSYFCWLAIYIFFIAAFSVLKSKKLKA
ncbi:MAG: hypothetical protein ACI4XC_08080 [Eubacterium sp.]